MNEATATQAVTVKRCPICGDDAPYGDRCSRCAADERGTDYSELHDEFSYEEEA